MRLALLLALAALALPASAQSRFVEACAASPDLRTVQGLDADALCQCVAERTVALGIPAADLDRSIDFPASDPSTLPDDVRAVAEVASETTVACALAQQTDGADPSATAGAQTEAGTAASTSPAAAPAAAPAVVPVAEAPAPAGLRTGNGTAPVQTQKSGAGSAIRIVG